MLKLKDLLQAYGETPIVKAYEWDNEQEEEQLICKPAQYDNQPDEELNGYTAEEAERLFGERNVLIFNTKTLFGDVYLIVMLEKEENGIAN